MQEAIGRSGYQLRYRYNDSSKDAQEAFQRFNL